MQPLKSKLIEINALILKANQRLIEARSIEEHMKCEAELIELLERVQGIVEEVLKGGIQNGEKTEHETQ